MLEDFRLKVFVTLVQQRNFTKAAAALHISQPAVSQHISELEKHVGVKLFQRQYGETVPTEAGLVFLRHAQKILSDYADIAKLFEPLHAREVRIAAAEEVYDYMMTSLLAEFCAVHPEITFLKTFPDEADIVVSIRPTDMEKGTFALSYSPSESFAATQLWCVLSKTLQPS